MQNEKWVEMLPRLSYGTGFVSMVISLHLLQSDLQNWIDDLGEDVSGSCEYSVRAIGNEYNADIEFYITSYQNERGFLYEVDWRLKLSFKMRRGIMYCSMTDEEKWVETENPLMVVKTFENSCNCMKDAISTDYEDLPAILRKKGGSK